MKNIIYITSDNPKQIFKYQNKIKEKTILTIKNKLSPQNKGWNLYFIYKLTQKYYGYIY